MACHHGHYIEALRKKGYKARYTGIDITPGFVEVASKRLPDEDFRVGDAMQLDFPDRSYDLVLLAGILQHLPEIAKPMREAFRVAEKYVLLSLYGTEGPILRRFDEGRFLNIFYSKDDILGQVPQGWTVVKSADVVRPHKPPPFRLFYQFLLKKEAANG